MPYSEIWKGLVIHMALLDRLNQEALKCSTTTSTDKNGTAVENPVSPNVAHGASSFPRSTRSPSSSRDTHSSGSGTHSSGSDTHSSGSGIQSSHEHHDVPCEKCLDASGSCHHCDIILREGVALMGRAFAGETPDHTNPLQAKTDRYGEEIDVLGAYNVPCPVAGCAYIGPIDHMVRHQVLAHSGRVVFPCGICREIFSSPCTFHTHRQEYHNNPRSLWYLPQGLDSVWG
ncbi:hypothetical protein BO71DRAFT_433372 [Aspergillus ellipticus CBS 707.79]|uniref:C2H2-type domain-containing protein n=1 Tax=Aspergillus ellipticus CBS 707.79 TaxID=1448320 RepID=A0A319DIC7_9EURO|nr:hypothetical protein BO71DRAFT_433372 [Aspergillus ellipticus CBS 707.79]